MSLGEIYITGEVKSETEYISSNLFSNPFGKEKVYKSGNIGRWTFSGNLETFGKAKTEIQDKTSSKISSNTSDTTKIDRHEEIPPKLNMDTQKIQNRNVADKLFDIKTYDYYNVNDILSRNTNTNFKTISETNPR